MATSSSTGTADPRLDLRSDAQRRDELARDIVSAALVRGRFILKGSVESDFFIDKYLFEARPAILRRIATHLACLLPITVQRLVTHEIGPLAVATAVSLETGLPLSIGHPDPEDEQRLRFSGELHPGDEAAVIEDVVSSGRRAISVMNPLRDRRINVTAVLAVIDREEGGMAAIEQRDAAFRPLYRLSDLHI